MIKSLYSLIQYLKKFNELKNQRILTLNPFGSEFKIESKG